MACPVVWSCCPIRGGRPLGHEVCLSSSGEVCIQTIPLCRHTRTSYRNEPLKVHLSLWFQYIYAGLSKIHQNVGISTLNKRNTQHIFVSKFKLYSPENSQQHSSSSVSDMSLSGNQAKHRHHHGNSHTGCFSAASEHLASIIILATIKQINLLTRRC